MNKPSPINTPIDSRRYRKWTTKFGSYRNTINRTVIEDWLNQFEKADQDLAARILDSVMYFELNNIAANFRAILSSINGWHNNPDQRRGRWFFVAMSGSAGESGDTMLREFRRANNMAHSSHNYLFISRSDLVRKQLTAEDTVVLIDDFSGTGNQICDVWNDPEVAFSELTAGAGTLYLVLVAATSSACAKIAQETPLLVVPGHRLTDKDNFFSDKCKRFSGSEKKTVLKYSVIADKKNPRGFGECGLLVVFNHGCPNNSIPILHAQSNKWDALFPRQI